MPTVRIKYPANKRDGYANINVLDFDPKVHELLDPADGHLVGLDAKSAKARAPAGGSGGAHATTLGDLRKQYRAKFGKRPSPKWDADAIKAKLAE